MREILLGLALVMLLAAPARAQDDDPVPDGSPKTIPENRLTFTVHGTASAPADQVDVELTVEAQGDDGETAETTTTR